MMKSFENAKTQSGHNLGKKNIIFRSDTTSGVHSRYQKEGVLGHELLLACNGSRSGIYRRPRFPNAMLE